MAHFFHHHHQHHAAAAPVFAAPPTHLHSGTRAHTMSKVSSALPRGHHPHTKQRVHPTAVVDPVLAYHAHAAHASIEFDLTLPPSHILISHGPSRSSYVGLPAQDLTVAATSPPVPHLRIQCEHLPWPIEVHPSAHSGAGVVTVGDVLEAIYRALRHRVRGTEYYASSTEVQHRVRDAYLRRCKRNQSMSGRAYETNNGLRRVDWLMKNTIFQGLSPGRSHDHWVMHVAQGAKSVKFRADL
ncbi:hypothetical protein K439DRAFT_1630359 [Ramaria rubella]|nr:hypothetical protein K439DRAFT_1630359 [Ramaria rubella]